MEKSNRITVICGHYGCGKTNLSINLAVEFEKERQRKADSKIKQTALLDVDIVNPYFRSSEYGGILAENNIRLIAPVFAGTTLDTPTLPPEMYGAVDNEEIKLLIDVGGDDAGITALGSIRRQLQEAGYQMIYVINRYRILSQRPEDAKRLLEEIEEASGLKADAVVNNSHLSNETTVETVEASREFAGETAELCGLPLMYHTIPDFAAKKAAFLPPDFKIVHRYVQFPWEEL